MTFWWLSSEHSAISLTADCDMPVYWICSPSLSEVSGEHDVLKMGRKKRTRFELLDSEFSRLTMAACSFVDSSIGPTADEADYFIAVNHADLALVSDIWADTTISWIYYSYQ